MRALVALLLLVANPPIDHITPRPPANEADLKYWLGVMARHGYTDEETTAAPGLTAAELSAARKRLNPTPQPSAKRPLEVLPYPGGRHPRIGFREGAIDPKRETKVSVFTPWDPSSYVVVDLPEALWSNLGLTYLAHTHVPTIWSDKGIKLPAMEWTRNSDGSFFLRRPLPNGIVYEAKVVPHRDSVEMSLTLVNGTKDKLTDLRVQMCVMLREARGFTKRTNDNKLFESPYACCRSDDGKRWIISAWDHQNRCWGNAPCPCLHADPKFPDLAPGASATLRGRLWFYEGDDIRAELKRLDQTNRRGDR